MGESAEVLLGSAARRVDGPSVYWRVWVWVRVHGTQRKAGHHPIDRQNLPYYQSGEAFMQLLSAGRGG